MYKYNQKAGIKTPNIFYPTSGLPLDNRVVVDTEADLFEHWGTFLIDTLGQAPYDEAYTGTYADVPVPLYEGMLVAVKQSNKIYMLKALGLFDRLVGIDGAGNKKDFYRSRSGDDIRIPSSITKFRTSDSAIFNDVDGNSVVYDGNGNFDNGFTLIQGQVYVTYGLWKEVSGAGSGSTTIVNNSYELGFIYKGEMLDFYDANTIIAIDQTDSNEYYAVEAIEETLGYLYRLQDGTKSYVCAQDDNGGYLWIPFDENNDLVWNHSAGYKTKSFTTTESAIQTYSGTTVSVGPDEYFVMYLLDENDNTTVGQRVASVNGTPVSASYNNSEQLHHIYLVGGISTSSINLESGVTASYKTVSIVNPNEDPIPTNWTVSSDGEVLVAAIVGTGSASITVGSTTKTITNVEICPKLAVISVNAKSGDSITSSNCNLIWFKEQ